PSPLPPFPSSLEAFRSNPHHKTKPAEAKSPALTATDGLSILSSSSYAAVIQSKSNDNGFAKSLRTFDPLDKQFYSISALDGRLAQAMNITNQKQRDR